jgi:hypothetical protein
MHISLSYLDGFDNDFDKTEQGHAVHSTMASAPSSITPVYHTVTQLRAVGHQFFVMLYISLLKNMASTTPNLTSPGRN